MSGGRRLIVTERASRRRFLTGLAGTVGLASLGCRPVPRRSVSAREVVRVVTAEPRRDGAGVSLRRSVGGAALAMLDPFLLLDELHSDRQEDFIAGFPNHPHRGFETVSYLIAGSFAHADSVGNHGRIGPGDAQWMTAGRGIVHSEMPEQEPGRELWGLQLWVNLPAARKMMRPRYQELGASAIPALDVADARVRLVAGTVGAKRGPIDGIAGAPTMLDATLPPGGRFHHELPGGHAAFVYLLAGSAQLGPQRTPLSVGQLAVLGAGREVSVKSDGGARLLLLAAAPIGEPVARRGPFVMNSEAELDQAVADYRSGRLTDG
ncbi:MAG: pirin family protein [Myxococcales bacterium]|nr:pirin family protein [Myxococcales bacterium]